MLAQFKKISRKDYCNKMTIEIPNPEEKRMVSQGETILHNGSFCLTFNRAFLSSIHRKMNRTFFPRESNNEDYFLTGTRRVPGVGKG